MFSEKPAGENLSSASGAAAENSAFLLGELSLLAYDNVVHAWMSELPIEAEIIRYGWKVISAAREAACFKTGATGGVFPGSAGSSAKTGRWAFLPEARDAAGRAASLRLENDSAVVLQAAARVRKEANRLEGLLRFNPGPAAMLIARCEPDYFILPALVRHFEQRFGDEPWAIIDQKRRLCLFRLPNGEPELMEQDAVEKLMGLTFTRRAGKAPAGDEWEELWRAYFRATTNKERVNPKVQRGFMPARYWKYLPEMKG
jgi:hypothetical protein